MNISSIENMNEKEAQEFLDSICSKFNILAKCYNVEKIHDVTYLEVCGIYDDNFHSMKKIREKK